MPHEQNPGTSIRAVARMAGVSTATVSRVLQNHPRVAPDTRARVELALSRCGYQANAAIRGLMSRVGSTGRSRSKETIIWLNNRTPAHLRNLPWERTVFISAKHHAENLGYGWDELWLADPRLSAKRVDQILRTRGIRGLLLSGPSNEWSQKHMDFPWDHFVTVILGNEPREPAVHRVGSDISSNIRTALNGLAERGFERIGIVLPPMYHESPVTVPLVAGALLHSHLHPERRRISLLHLDWKEFDPARKTARRKFLSWIDQENLDAVVGMHLAVARWLLEGDRLRVAFAHLSATVQPPLEWLARESCWKTIRDGSVFMETAAPGIWAGIDSCPKTIGASAVDVLVGLLSHNQIGLPRVATRLLVPGVWVDGKTLGGKIS